MKAIVPMLALLLLLLPTRPVTQSAPETPEAAAPAFCLDGPVMSQLLQGFGCDDLAGRVTDTRLNCSTRILREQVVDGQARLDLVIECECEDALEGEAPLRRLDGQWQVVVDL